MARPLASDRSWTFPLDADELWARLTDVEEYPRWWPWLRTFGRDGDFVRGARWECVVAPPLPYVVRFTVTLDRVDERRGAVASVSGDIRGDATLSVADGTGGTSTARLRSRLTPSDPVLRRAALLVPPVTRWGHDWVLDQGRRQFVERAIRADRDAR